MMWITPLIWPLGAEALAMLTVVIPCRNEATHLPLLLAQLAVQPQLVTQVVVVDGGSTDASVLAARLMGVQVLHTSPGRGLQMARGARDLETPWVLFLHADVALPPGWGDRVTAALRTQGGRDQAWYFELAVNGRGWALRLLELIVGLRSHWQQLPFGDQGLLLSRALYQRVGGIRPLPLMEDLDLVERLRPLARLRSLRLPLLVDGTRWRQQGVLKTSLTNLSLRRAWRRGVPAAVLVQRYYGQQLQA